jgi:hypothetical protein
MPQASKFDMEHTALEFSKVLPPALVIETGRQYSIIWRGRKAPIICFVDGRYGWRFDRWGAKRNYGAIRGRVKYVEVRLSSVCTRVAHPLQLCLTEWRCLSALAYVKSLHYRSYIHSLVSSRTMQRSVKQSHRPVMRWSPSSRPYSNSSKYVRAQTICKK